MSTHRRTVADVKVYSYGLRSYDLFSYGLRSEGVDANGFTSNAIVARTAARSVSQYRWARTDGLNSTQPTTQLNSTQLNSAARTVSQYR